MARIAFCQDIYVELMGFMSMSAILREHGHSVEVFIDEQINRKAFLNELKTFRPDIIGFSLLSPTVSWALDLAKSIKKEMNPVIVLGGVHTIIHPQLIEEPCVDIVCIGEGEYSILELANRVDRKESYVNIPSFYVKTADGVVKNQLASPIELDELPFINRDMYDKYRFFRNSPYLRLMVGRGCPFHCTFCTNSFLSQHYGGVKNYVRKLSPERAIAEIESHVAKRKPRQIFFIDEVLWVSNKWLREFLTLYKKKIGIKFTANFRFGSITEDDIKLLAEAGAKCLIVASETGDEHQRIQKFEKNVKDEEIFRIGNLLSKYHVKFTSSALFGLPGDTFESHIKRFNFFIRLKPHYVWTAFFQPYDGIKLRDDEDIKAHMPTGKDFEAYVHSNVYLEIPDKKRLVNLGKVYPWIVWFPWSKPFFIRLTKWNAPFFFDVIFMIHFTYYSFAYEGISVYQYFKHIQIFGVYPLLRKMGLLKNVF